MNWHTRLQNILKNDIKSRPKALNDLKQEIINKIHGNTNINTKTTKELLNNISEQFKDKLGNIELEIKASHYNDNKDNGMDTSFLHVSIDIKGNWNGFVYFETSAGINNSTKKSIYYLSDYDFKIKSKLEEKIKDYYIDTYKILLEKEFLDLATTKNLYLQLDTKREAYELWDSDPSSYSDTMSGRYDYNDRYDRRYLRTYEMYKTLKKLQRYNKISEFIEDEEIDYTTETVEWRNYYI